MAPTADILTTLISLEFDNRNESNVNVSQFNYSQNCYARDNGKS